MNSPHTRFCSSLIAIAVFVVHFGAVRALRARIAQVPRAPRPRHPCKRLKSYSGSTQYLNLAFDPINLVASGPLARHSRQFRYFRRCLSGEIAELLLITFNQVGHFGSYLKRRNSEHNERGSHNFDSEVICQTFQHHF